MKMFEKNVWLIFYLATLFFTICLNVFAYIGWNNLYEQYERSQESKLKLIANSTHSLYKTHEVMLDILGHRFIEDRGYTDNSLSMEILDAALLESPAITSIAIATPQGQMLFATNGLDVSGFPNLLEQEATRESFLSVMNSQKMMFGRTYFFKPFNDWIVPIRKAIRDREGNVRLVITAALRLEDSFGFIVKNADESEQFTTFVIRNEDGFVQYASNGADSKYEIYRSAFPSERLSLIEESFVKHSEHADEDFKRTGHIHSFPFEDEKGVDYLASIKHDPTYKHWILTVTRKELVTAAFLDLLKTYIFIFLAIEILLYVLVRVIFNADKKRNEALLFQATHDKLTGLPNRSYLQTDLNNWIDDITNRFSLLYIDLDRFKSINDSFGHLSGDRLLVELASRLRSVTSTDSIILRHGGDEFVVLTPQTDSDEVLSLARKVLEVVRQPFRVNDLRLHVDASIGISQYPQHGESFENLLRSADLALYEAKKIKKSIHLFEDRMEGYLENVKLEQALRTAISDNELFMVYQPQVTSDGKFYGVEALVRWNSKTHGFIAPDRFISIAEASGQMPKIGNFITQRTLQDIREIQCSLNKHFRTSINISVRQLMDPDFAESIIDTIRENKLIKESITLEITESLFIEDIDSIIPLLMEFKDHGLDISMDDFGTGYSSLSILRRLPIDELKIDKSFIDAMSVDESSQKMVQNIIMIGKNLNMYIVAEGVETSEQVEILKRFNCDRMQGYHFSKPLSIEDLVKYIKSQDK